MTSVFENEKKFRKRKKFEKKETRGERLKKVLKNTIEQGEPKTLPKRNLKNIMEIDKSLKNLKKDYRFPGKQPKNVEPSPRPRKPGEQKEMIPLKSGGRAMYKSGSKGCKLAMKGKGRAYGKNS